MILGSERWVTVFGYRTIVWFRGGGVGGCCVAQIQAGSRKTLYTLMNQLIVSYLMVLPFFYCYKDSIYFFDCVYFMFLQEMSDMDELQWLCVTFRSPNS